MTKQTNIEPAGCSPILLDSRSFPSVYSLATQRPLPLFRGEWALRVSSIMPRVYHCCQRWARVGRAEASQYG